MEDKKKADLVTKVNKFMKFSTSDKLLQASIKTLRTRVERKIQKLKKLIEGHTRRLFLAEEIQDGCSCTATVDYFRSLKC